MTEPKKPRKPKREPATTNWQKTLRALRYYYGDGTHPLHQELAAARLHTSVGSWRNWEQGRRTPSPAIVRLLHLTFPEFFAKKT